MIAKGGMFSSDVVEFVIECEAQKWRVVRRYEDALWLREQLQRLFPGTLVTLKLKVVASVV